MFCTACGDRNKPSSRDMRRFRLAAGAAKLTEVLVLNVPLRCLRCGEAALQLQGRMPRYPLDDPPAARSHGSEGSATTETGSDAGYVTSESAGSRVTGDHLDELRGDWTDSFDDLDAQDWEMLMGGPD